MSFHNLPSQVLARLTEAASDVTVRTLSLPEVTLLMLLICIEVELYWANNRPRELQFFRWWHRKCTTICGKARLPLQFGDHRPYVVATILHCTPAEWGGRAARRNSAAPDGKLQDLLFEWLNWDETSNEVASVALLFGEPVRNELFSYVLYAQRLIARCDPVLLCSEVSIGMRLRQASC